MNESRKKIKDPVHIGNIITQVLSACRRDLDEDFVKVWRLWDDAVGEVVSQNARPSAFKANCLYINVSSSPWIHQLQFLKKEIMARLNSALGKELISEIRFKIGG